MPRRITSPANNRIKEAVRLKRKRHRFERRLFLVEGEDLLDAALRRDVMPRQVFVLEGNENTVAQRLEEAASVRAGGRGPEVALHICSGPVMERLSELGSGSRVVAVFAMLDLKFPVRMKDGAGPILYLAGTGDPGNVGTLMRSAAALGAAAVILGPGSADPYSPKALRATMGAIFQVPFYLTVNPGTLVSWAARSGIDVVCADAHAGASVWQAPLEGVFVLVLGSERKGIPRRLKEAATATIHIPLSESTESINVAVAGTVILYEAMKQRVEDKPAGDLMDGDGQAGSCEKTVKPPGQETQGRT